MNEFNIYYRYNRDVIMGHISITDKALEIIEVAHSLSEIESFSIFADGSFNPSGTFKPNGRRLCET